MARILVLGVKVPFTKGGQEVLVGSLVRELTARGHAVDVVELPFSGSPKERLLAEGALWRSLALTEFGGEKVDLVIATKFPSYFAAHPCKSVWLVHQHRFLYDLYGGAFSDLSDDPRDEQLRRMLVDADSKTIGECAFVGAISKNVATRLEQFNGIHAEALYPPLPLAGKYRSGPPQDYILSVGRLCRIKRVDMLIRALPTVHHFIKLKIVGAPDEAGMMEYLKSEIDKHHLWDRVEFMGRVSDEALLDLYASSLGVYYAPHNEDYGYVTLEAMASKKPVVTAHDSGGVLEFVTHEQTGIITEPTPDAVGHGINRLVENKEYAAKLGEAGYARLEELGVLSSGWDHVIGRLLSPLSSVDRVAQS